MLVSSTKSYAVSHIIKAQDIQNNRLCFQLINVLVYSCLAINVFREGSEIEDGMNSCTELASSLLTNVSSLMPPTPQFASQLPLLPHTRRLNPLLLALLICCRKNIILPLDPFNLPLPPAPRPFIRNVLHQLGQTPSRKELVLAVIQLPLLQRLFGLIYTTIPSNSGDPKHLLQDIDIIGDAEQIPRVLVGKEVVELVEARPGDAAEAERAGFVGGCCSLLQQS